MSVRMRPRFEVVVPCLTASEHLRSALVRDDAMCRGEVFGRHAVIHVPEAEEHLWSPFLSLDLVAQRDGTLVRGLFGPKPSIWSLFVAAYGVCAILVVFALGFAYAQWSIGQAPSALAVVPLAGVGALVTTGFARYGQWKGRAQMDQLRTFVDDALAPSDG